MKPSIKKLASGFNHFRTRYFNEQKELYRDLVEQGQKPKVAVIACADSRVDPAIVLQVEPGDIFAIRNVANLVPPYQSNEEGDVSYHGTSAALEFAVSVLGVEHVVVIGHAHCSGIQAMINGQEGEQVSGSFIPAWTTIAAEAFHRAKSTTSVAEGAEFTRCCERQAVLVSLENLRTFPFIQEKIDAGKLDIHGWYLDIAEGELTAYDPNTKKFGSLG